MLELNKGHYRVLYIIAKQLEPVRKTTISQATARWNAHNRDRILRELENAELVSSQVTPAGQGKPEGRYYWLSQQGVPLVEALEGQGKIKALPPGWMDAA